MLCMHGMVCMICMVCICMYGMYGKVWYGMVWHGMVCTYVPTLTLICMYVCPSVSVCVYRLNRRKTSFTYYICIYAGGHRGPREVGDQRRLFQDSVPDGSYNDPFLSSVISMVAPTWCHGAI